MLQSALFLRAFIGFLGNGYLVITLWVVGMLNATGFSLLLEHSSGLNLEIHTNCYSEKMNTNVPETPNLKLRLQDFYIPALTSHLKFLTFQNEILLFANICVITYLIYTMFLKARFIFSKLK